MRVKTKLTLGIGLLFLLIIILATVSVKYINALTGDTKGVMVANYNTLKYSRQMLIALDEDVNGIADFKLFKSNLDEQLKNITEEGELDITNVLTEHFSKLQNNPHDTLQKKVIRTDLYELMNLNMNAIVRKSKVAEQTAHRANTWIVVTATLCFLISFSLLINFPGHIANPIKQLTQSIQEIANKNYSQRLHFKGNDEFADLSIAFNSMSAKLEEYENSNLAKLLFEKKRIEILINNMPDPIIGLDENLKILFANEQSLKILALKSEQLIGSLATDISLKNDLMQSLTNDIISSSKNTTAFTSKPMKIYADGKESYFEKEILLISLKPTGENIDKQIGYVLILKNITPFKELDFAKTNFIATVSHELKTPIASILMSLKLIEDKRVGELNVEQSDLMQHIKEDSERLLKITSELLNMSQVETGKIQLSLQSANPLEMMNYAINANRSQAEKSGIKLVNQIEEKIPNVSADPEKTAWVLTNLVANAIRYSHENAQVILSAKEINTAVEFSVKDFGKGIESKFKEKVFDRYFRIPGTNKEGTGLGLAISKEFIEAQGGKISLASELGMGCEFKFVLPKA